VTTCSDLATTPDAGSHHDDYQKVDALLDAAEQSIRQSFESSNALAVDRHTQAVEDLLANWSINEARDLAWASSLALWELRGVGVARDAFLRTLARTVSLASAALLVAV
jgi:hypothetical protein